MLTESQSHVLTEIINAGVGRAGSVLSEMVGSRVDLHVPGIGVTGLIEIPDYLEIEEASRLASVRQRFHGSLEGKALLLLSQSSGDTLAVRLIGDGSDITSMEAERTEALTEVGNILLNSVLGTMSNVLGHRFEYEVPVYREGSLDELLMPPIDASERIPSDARILYAVAHFDIAETRISGSVLIAFPASSFDRLVMLVNGALTMSP